MQAITALESITGTYRLTVMDRDGSNAISLFPTPDQTGLKPLSVTYVWSPDGEQLALIYEGDLWVVDVDSGKSQQLTGDGQTINPTWTK